MRILPVVGLAMSALGLTACTYVERTRPAPPQAVIVQPPAQTVVPQAPPPTVTVRPTY